MSIYLRNIIRFALLILIQVLLLNRIPLNWWAPPYISFVYPLFILLLPISTPTTFLMVFAFFTGLTMDAFMNTGGIHAMACVAMAFSRRQVLEFLLPQRLSEYQTATPGPKIMSWGSFLAYSAILMLIHNLIYTIVEVWALQSLWYFLIKTGITFLTSMIFVVVYLLLFTKSINSKAFE